MKTIRYGFWAIVGLVLIIVGLANRGMVTLRAMPEALGDLLGRSPDITLPLFVVIFISVGVGLLIGFVWEWLREHRFRADARQKAREVDALKREVAEAKAGSGTHGDDVLAIMNQSGR